MKKIVVAVIGCGRISVMHFESIKIMQDAQLVACCDICQERADSAAQKYGCWAYTDYLEMLDCESLDAVHICLPHYLHCKVACAAFERGVAVLSEKPMDISYEAAEAAHLDDFVEYEGGKDYWGFQHVRQIRQFYKALLGKESLEISGEEALKTHRLICEIYKIGRKFV